METQNDKATSEWLNAQKKSTQATYKIYWRHFLSYIGMSGDEILAARRNDKDYYWEKRVLQVKTWAIEKGFSENTAKALTTAARSFFAYHRLPLQFRRGEKARLHEARLKSEDYRFSLQDLKKLYDVADLQEKYVVTGGKSFGLRAGDFMKLTRGDLEPYIDKEPPISIGQFATQKESVTAFPFIDSDAQPIIKLMLEKMTCEGRTTPSERMLTYTNKIQLSRVLKRLVHKAGLNVGGKQVRFHCLRKFLADHLSSHMSESKWKQVVGKKISEGAYVSPDSLREDYKRATAETCFTKALTTSEDMELLAQKEALKMIAKMQGISEERLARIFKTRKTVTTEDEIKALEEELKEKTRKDCPDGEHCEEDFKQIPESELLSHLKEGWQISYKLDNGQVIVKAPSP